MSEQKYKGIWVFAEQKNGVINETVFEMLAKCTELKTVCGESITAVLLGWDVLGLAKELFAYGADEVIIAENQNLSEFSARPYQDVLTKLAEKYMPSIILYGATEIGRDLAPRMMVSLNTGLTADAIDLGFDDSEMFYQTTPAYGGKLMAHIAIPERRPQMSTVKPKSFEPAKPDYSRSGKIIIEEVKAERELDYEILGHSEKENVGVPIEKAKVLVSCGRAVKTEKELEQIQELASLLGAQLAGSRPFIESGLLPPERQIGISGATVKPELIVNIAISGAVQYRAAMEQSKHIVSVNLDKNAPIFGISKYGTTVDFNKLVPALCSEIRRRKTRG